MSQVRHSIEVLSDKLADAMLHEIDLLAEFLRPPGDRPPFTRKVGIEWWLKHRMDPDVQAYLESAWSPEEVMALDASLSRRIEQESLV